MAPKGAGLKKEYEGLGQGYKAVAEAHAERCQVHVVSGLEVEEDDVVIGPVEGPGGIEK